MRSTKLTCLALGVVLALAPASALAQDTGSEPPMTGDPEADALISRIEDFAAEMTQARALLHSDHLSPDALVEVVGTDPTDLLQWLIDSTRWLPYEGALRGANGVLMDRSGSSLDRALLLARLLTTAGLEVRLAHTRLPDMLAAETAASALARPWVRDRDPFLAPEEEVVAHQQRVATAAADLADLAGFTDARGPVAPGPDAAAVIADHWWVQAASDGAWVDLDPLFPDDSSARPPVDRTIDPDEVPDELRHSVTVRVVIERAEDGSLIEEIPLEHTIPLGGDEPLESLELTFDLAVPPDLASVAAETQDAAEAARLATHWRPMLEHRSGTFAGDWFSAAGVLESPASLAQTDALSEGTSALGGLGANSPGSEPAASHLSAAWIEYEIKATGRESRTERRELFDLAAVARSEARPVDGLALDDPESNERRGLAFLGESSVLLESAVPHPDAVLDAYLQNWIELRPAMIALVFQKSGVDDPRIGPSLAAPRLRPLDLIAVSSARSHWSTSDDAFIGRPNVWSSHRFLEPGSREPVGSRAMDVVSNGVDVVPGTSDPRRVRLEQGILDTLVEHVVGGGGEGLNAWQRFAQRDPEDSEWMVLRPGVPIDAELAAALPDVELARLDRALADGYTVVVAPSTRSGADEPFTDWWRIEDDGSTLGMGYRGWGSEYIERDATQKIAIGRLEKMLAEDAYIAEVRANKQLLGYVMRSQARNAAHRRAVEAAGDTVLDAWLAFMGV